MAQSKVRYAVVGLGYIAQAAVLPSFAHARRNSSLHAIVSGSTEKLNQLGDKYRIPVRASYDQYERCLQEVDAVYIATPNSEHSDFAVRAAKAGKHVLCEKPLAVTQEECHRMIKAAKQNNIKMMTAYRLHFEPLFLEVLDLVRSGRIGEPRYFSSSFSMHAKPGGIRTQRELGGGTLYDLGIYCINTARLMFAAEPTEVFATSIDGARSNMPEIDEMTAGLMRFDGDRLATFTTSFNANGVSEFRIVGTEGSVHAEPAYRVRRGARLHTDRRHRRAEEEGPAPRPVRRGDYLLFGLRAERQESGTVSRRGLLGCRHRQCALSVGRDRQARQAGAVRARIGPGRHAGHQPPAGARARTGRGRKTA